MSQHSLQGNFEIFDASSYRVGIVVAMFNADVSAQLLKSAQDMCALYGIKPENITVHAVPGSVEIPLYFRLSRRAINLLMHSLHSALLSKGRHHTLNMYVKL